jgi:hypothetical protein
MILKNKIFKPSIVYYPNSEFNRLNYETRIKLINYILILKKN